MQRKPLFQRERLISFKPETEVEIKVQLSTLRANTNNVRENLKTESK